MESYRCYVRKFIIIYFGFFIVGLLLYNAVYETFITLMFRTYEFLIAFARR